MAGFKGLTADFIARAALYAVVVSTVSSEIESCLSDFPIGGYETADLAAMPVPPISTDEEIAGRCGVRSTREQTPTERVVEILRTSPRISKDLLKIRDGYLKVRKDIEEAIANLQKEQEEKRSPENILAEVRKEIRGIKKGRIVSSTEELAKRFGVSEKEVRRILRSLSEREVKLRRECLGRQIALIAFAKSQHRKAKETGCPVLGSDRLGKKYGFNFRQVDLLLAKHFSAEELKERQEFVKRRSNPGSKNPPAKQADKNKKSYSIYAAEYRYLVVLCVRRRVRKEQWVPSNELLAELYGMTEEAVSDLLTDRLSPEDETNRKRLVRETDRSISSLPRGNDLRPGGKRSQGKGYLRYPARKRQRLIRSVVSEVIRLRSTKERARSYEELADEFTMAVKAVRGLLKDELPEGMFEERKGYSFRRH